jgi:glycosyltransferase involved in cell wall biosynthesis
MAAGTPVIGCGEGGFAEVLEDGVDSFLVDPTPENIAEKINYLRGNPDVVKRMGERGLVKAGQYTWGKTASELLELIMSLL